jgi:uncharacterized membrane protein YhaH (DUF805 family)
MERPDMNLAALLFSFEGRINRAKYWLALLIWCAATALVFVLFGVAGTAAGIEPTLELMIVLTALVVIPILISSIAVGIKRLHDRDKSGWWLLVFYVAPYGLAFLGGMLVAAMRIDDPQSEYLIMLINLPIYAWALIELGILRGTVGPNRFGEDPIAPPTVLRPAD